MNETPTRMRSQVDADSLRHQAVELERQAKFLSAHDGGVSIEARARQLRKEAQAIEERLPA